MMNKKYSQNDHRGLIYESFRIENISVEDCRSIFLDWLLGLADEFEADKEIEKLYLKYGLKNKTHPMTKILSEGLNITRERPTRRVKKKGAI